MKRRSLTGRLVLKSLITLIFLSISIACQKTEKAPKKYEETVYYGTIVAAGDSLTAGFGLSEDQAYPALLGKRLLKDGYRYRVVNAGISGETSSGLLSRTRWILTLKPDIVIIETGANDGFRGVDPEITRRNITETVRILKANRVKVILAGMRISENLGREFADAFMGIYPAVAEKEGIILIPFFLEGVAGNPSLNQPDGIHPTAEGYRIVAETVYPYVLKGINLR